MYRRRVHSQTTCPDDGATADGYAAVERCIAAAVDDEEGLVAAAIKGTFEAPEKAKCMGLGGYDDHERAVGWLADSLVCLGVNKVESVVAAADAFRCRRLPSKPVFVACSSNTSLSSELNSVSKMPQE